MKYDDEFEFPEGDFIPAIHNYCDRWCERCIYIDQCMVFEMDKKIRKKIEADKRLEKSMEENKNFWNQINKIVEETAELIDEEIPLVKEESFSFLDDPDFAEEAEDAMKDHEKIRQKAKNHKVSKVALKYEKAVGKWFKERENKLKIVFSEDKYGMKVTYPGIKGEDALKLLSNAVEVANWYQIQIWVKLQRALSGYFEEIEDSDLYEDFSLKDSDGSAFVVLMGIDRSIGAWNHLYGELPAEKESIKPMIQMLMWLRPEVEKMFPGARNFEWPPKMD